MIDGMEDPQAVTGTVKWFDPGKGFGFVVPEAGGADILLHANVLRKYGQSSIADAARVEMTVQMTSRGAQAVEILSIEPPEGTGPQSLTDMPAELGEDLDTLPLEPARVKWFDKTKGFGFANVFGSADDVFIHIEVLRRSGLSDLMPGEAVVLRVVEGKRGRMSAQVLSWEAGVDRE